MALVQALLCLLTFSLLVSGTNADTNACVNEDPCTCKFNDGNVLSLRSLAKSDSTAAFKVLNVQNLYDFFFNPCLTFTEGSCGGGDLAVCQHVVGMGQFGDYSCGTQSSAQFVHRDDDSASLYLRFENGNSDRKSYVKLTCSNGTESAFSFVSEDPLKQYNFELTSPCACPGHTDGCDKLPKVQCIKEDECSCRMSDGSGTINLRALSSPKTPIKYTTSGYRQFLYNPCQGFSISNKNASVNQCTDVSLCERENIGLPKERNLNLGKPNDVKFEFSQDDNLVSLIYTGAAGRQSTVELVCDRGAREIPVLELVRASEKDYTFRLKSVCACPGGCVAPARACRKVDSCSCKYDDGSGTISLHFLDNPYAPLKTITNQGDFSTFSYYYNPCSGLKLGGGCSNVSACQQVNDSYSQTSVTYRLGAVLPVGFISDVNGQIAIQYSGGDNNRTYKVVLECDASARIPVFGNATENPINQYTFSLRSKCACPDVCPPK